MSCIVEECRPYMHHNCHFKELSEGTAYSTCMHVGVFCPKVSPLKAINRPQVSLLSVSKPIIVQKVTGPICIPNLHPFH